MTRHQSQFAKPRPARPWPVFAARARFALALLLTLTPEAAALASTREESRRCDLAAARASELTGVPIDLLLAITRAETGRGSAGREPYPWPWTINADGVGHWYDTRESAISAAEAHLAGSTGTFDIGCFQLNIRWHSGAFETLDEMFDPQRNAEYAAGFLLELYQESGDWKQAVAAYHSRTPKLAERYVSRVKAILEGPTAAPQFAEDTAAAAAPHENRFPLLQAGETGSVGSLVPSQVSRGPLFGAKS